MLGLLKLKSGSVSMDGKDISKLILFLLSDKSKYISGQNLVIDEGWTL